MKILSVEQIRAWDAYTIEQEPIASVDLMERAARAFADWFASRFPDVNKPLYIVCGSGNNGGDGLAVARLLAQRHYSPEVLLCRIGRTLSADCEENYRRLKRLGTVPICELEKGGVPPDLRSGGLLIDAVFGSGLNRPVEGYWADFLEWMNAYSGVRVAIDIPSGLFAERPLEGVSVKADYTLSFELPKLAFFLPETGYRVGEWVLRSIGLHAGFIRQAETPWHFLTEANLQPFLRQRRRFEHKGNFGHALLVAGSYGKMGAALLAGRAALRTGAGLVSLHLPRCGYAIAQEAFQEAMVSVDHHEYLFSRPPSLDPYAAVGVGPGLGTNSITRRALLELLEQALASSRPLVLDADALNLLAEEPEPQKYLPKGSILTPHPGEFRRLFGDFPDAFASLAFQRQLSEDWGVVVVLKGAYTCVTLPDGSAWFNSTGNPGMATAGSGDVLTGVITGLLAQGYRPELAALLGVWLHGKAGDLAAEALEQEALLAGDLVLYLGKAFKFLRSWQKENASSS